MILLKLKTKISQLLFSKTIPSYEVKRGVLLEFAKRFQIDTFVETGTFLGDTVDYFREYFSRIYSIELSKDLALEASHRFKDSEHIDIIQGDSSAELILLLKKIDSRALFWLDGHYSSEFMLNGRWIVTARGEKDTPIKSELLAILSCTIDHVILIDDARLFNGKNDYPKIKAIKEICHRLKPNYSIEILNDIIRLYPNNL